VPAATPLSFGSRPKSKKSTKFSPQESEGEMSRESTPVDVPLETVHQLPHSV
jgi:hypothetical protein